MRPMGGMWRVEVGQSGRVVVCRQACSSAITRARVQSTDGERTRVPCVEGGERTMTCSAPAVAAKQVPGCVPTERMLRAQRGPRGSDGLSRGTIHTVGHRGRMQSSGADADACWALEACWALALRFDRVLFMAARYVRLYR